MNRLPSFLFAVLLLAAVSFVAFAGGKQEGSGTASTGGGKTLTIATASTPWLPGLKAIVPEWEKQTGNHIVFDAFPYNGLYEKLQAVLTSGGTDFDIVFMDDVWNALFQGGGYLTPLTDLESSYKEDPQIISYANVCCWDPKANYSSASGIPYGIPINGNFHIFYYRKDLFEQAGIPTPPKTWTDVVNAAKKLYDPNKPLYGYVLRGQKGNGVVFNWMPVLRSYGGDIFVDAPKDWTIRINDKQALEALNTYLGLLKYAPPGSGDLGQSDMIALLSTGKAAQAIVVAAGASAMDNPNSSTIPGKMAFTVTPKADVPGGKHAPLLGMWTMAIPKNVSMDQKKLAFQFMTWVTSKDAQTKYTLAGAIPVRKDVLFADYPGHPELRYLKAMAESYDLVTPRPRIKVWFQLEDILGLHLNRAIVGQETAKQALDNAAQEILTVMKGAGYKTSIKQ